MYMLAILIQYIITAWLYQYIISYLCVHRSLTKPPKYY